MDRGRLLSDTTDYSNRLTKEEALLKTKQRKRCLGVEGGETRDRRKAMPSHSLPGLGCLSERKQPSASILDQSFHLSGGWARSVFGQIVGS